MKSLGPIGLGLGLGALVCEFLVRVWVPQPITVVSSGLYLPDPSLRYRLAPNFRGTLANHTEFVTTVAINSLGLRGPEISPEPGDARRILMLGDSFVFGWGVEAEEAVAAQLETELASRGQAVEVINAGHPGWGLRDELTWLERDGLRLEPDLVLLGILMNNDLLDATAKRHHELISEELPEAGPARQPQIWFYRRSHFFRLAKRRGVGMLVPWLGLDEPWGMEYLRDVMATLAKNPPPLIREARQVSRDTLNRLSDLAAERDLPLAVLLIPSQIQVDPPVFEALCAMLELDPAEHDPDAPTRFFTQVLEQRGTPSLDPSDHLRAATRAGEQLYYRHDPHWTAAGHRVTADALADFLTSRQL